MFGVATDAAIDVIRTSRSALEASARRVQAESSSRGAKRRGDPGAAEASDVPLPTVLGLSSEACIFEGYVVAEEGVGEGDDASGYGDEGDWAHSPPRGCGA